jgi:hypothetical protein
LAHCGATARHEELRGFSGSSLTLTPRYFLNVQDTGEQLYLISQQTPPVSIYRLHSVHLFIALHHLAQYQ